MTRQEHGILPGAWRVGDTNNYVDYWPPTAPNRRLDSVDDILTQLRERIALLSEDIMAKQEKDNETRSAPVGPFIDKLVDTVHAEDMKDRDDDDLESRHEWTKKHII